MSKKDRSPLVENALNTLREDVYLFFKNLYFVVGVFLLTLGLLNFRSDRYCDGNQAEYFSCTRPTTYYYYEPWAIIVIIFGVLLLTLWWLRRRTFVVDEAGR